jgi:hypothetical protein
MDGLEFERRRSKQILIVISFNKNIKDE